jgi:hypothetical protein
MTSRNLLTVLALLAVATTGAFANSLSRERNAVASPRNIEQKPLVAFYTALESSRFLAEEKTSTESGGSNFYRNNPYLRVALGFLVPGLPQHLNGQWRSYGYFALEGASIAGLIVLNSQANARQERYTQLAGKARSNYVYPGLRNNSEEITDPSLPGYGEYYENLTKWESSGDYDDDPSQEGVQPETNPGTYNGHQWEIAKINNYSGTNGGLPVPENSQEEINALEAYMQQVYPMRYNWDWTGLDAESQRYLDLFNSSGDAFRRRSTFATILLANHLISGLDVLIQERVNRSQFMRSNRLRLHLEMEQRRVTGSIAVQPRLSLSHRF